MPPIIGFCTVWEIGNVVWMGLGDEGICLIALVLLVPFILLIDLGFDI